MDIASLVDVFPLTRGGGAFFIAIGFGILVGSFGSRSFRIVCLIAGAALGVAAMAVGGATKVISTSSPSARP